MRNSQLLLEAVWLLFTVLLACLVLLPIWTELPQFPFITANFVYVVTAVTMTRYLFFLRISWLRDRFYIQGGLMFAVVPLIFYMVQYFNAFIIFFDENGPDVLSKTLAPATAPILNGYLHAEYRFFGVWAIVAAGLLPFRMLFNIWHRYRTLNS